LSPGERITHGHDHEKAPGGHQHQGGRSLLISFFLTAGFMLVEAVGGWLTNSLALLSDAGHMLTDAGALGMSLLALRIGARAPTRTHTFGYRRFEILAALFNGLALWAITGVIFREAYLRLSAPPRVGAKGMMLVAAIGLAINLISIVLLHAHKDESLNIRGAFLHVAADSLGSVGALAAGVIIYYSGWTLVDPLVSIGIGLLILWSTWGLIRDSIHILLLGVPVHLDYEEVGREIRRYPGVCCIYDLHLWSISSGQDALSAHVVVRDDYHRKEQLLREITDGLDARFNINHVTLQIEESHELRIARSGACLIDAACTVCSTQPGPAPADSGLRQENDKE
jgi:cobalt-zinc-cadmium efflux system protein